MTDRIERPALRYYGGKFRLAPWIISHFPKHQAYVEPCGGAASVLLQKPRSPLETYNDLDGNVVNFFRVLRDRPEELIRKIRLTPWSREEKELSFEDCTDELESARRFWVSVTMSISASRGYAPGFRMIKTAEHCHSLPDLYPENNEPALRFAVDRFAGVQIENLSALDCIKRYDYEEALIYFDPPYLPETRTHTRYFLEADSQFHIEAAALLREARGYVVVSGYSSSLYSELYEAHGWQRVDKDSLTNSGQVRIESLWLNPKTVQALAAQKQPAPQMSLFQEAAL